MAQNITDGFISHINYSQHEKSLCFQQDHFCKTTEKCMFVQFGSFLVVFPRQLFEVLSSHDGVLIV